MKRGCPCGASNKKPHTLEFARDCGKLWGVKVEFCPLCNHIIEPPRRAHDVRKLSTYGYGLAHTACVRAARKAQP